MDAKIQTQSSVKKIEGEDGGQNINKIRDILFGTEMRKNDSRFDSLEAHFNQESVHLRADMEQRMEAIETLIRAEFETLTNKLQSEKKERQESLLAVDVSLKTADVLLNTRIGELETRSLDEIRKLRHQAHEDIKNVRHNLQKLRDENQALMEKELDILRKTKIDKASIAALFSNDGV
ncbi:MAG: hypothetical protein KAG26_05855 [Methylococcales bacterium]|nr:hypothetical protein [Methylococcales bacterium]